MGSKLAVVSAFGVLCCLLADKINGATVVDIGSKTSHWTVFNSNNKSATYPSQVPGSIYSDLERAKAIPDIYKDFNDVDERWVSQESWTFATEFDLKADILSKKFINLVAHGLDTIGHVTLNEKSLGPVDNMFVRYQWPVRGLLKETGNKLQIKFESAPKEAKAFYDKYLKEKYSIVPVCVPSEQKGECHVNMLRKMQASFSWDWGPAFPTQGIWKPITIEAYDELIIRSISVDTEPSSTQSNGSWSVDYSIFVESGAPTETSVKLHLYLDEELIAEKQFVVDFNAHGEGKLAGKVSIPDKIKVKPWFPNGVGEPKLYKLTAKITAAKEEVEKSIKIGFRTIKLIQTKEPSTTEAYSFYFTVNDVPIWSKGSNWIPAHVLTEQLTEQYIRELLHSAKDANMNMLRVWGGGIYESDYLYEVADELGLLIWQDMMFACATYPTNGEFLDSVKTEIRQQIRRLQHHPSIALWAGNNENEGAISNGWWLDVRKGQPHYEDYRKDYRTLYIDTIWPIVSEEDKSRVYVPSSPSNGVEDVHENYIAADPQSHLYGDVHFYTTTGDVWDWKRYPSAKFASEYGFQSWSSLKTFEPAISKKDLIYPLDADMKHREHSPGGLTALDKMIDLQLPLPTKSGERQLEDYIYVSQIFQSMAIKIETEFYRRNRAIKPNGEGHTMGALYWQLNDIWPTVSWASVEFGGKWKMLQYYARRFFDNLLVDAVEEGEELKVYVVRDDHQDVTRDHMKLSIHVYDWSSLTSIYSKEVAIETKPFSSAVVFNESMKEFLQTAKCTSRAHCLIQVETSNAFNNERKSNFLLLDKPKNAVGLPKAKIHVKEISVPTDGVGFMLELETDAIAPWVWLDFSRESGLEGAFTDNGFMLTSKLKNVGIKHLNKANVTKEEVAKALVIKSLKDVE